MHSVTMLSLFFTLINTMAIPDPAGHANSIAKPLPTALPPPGNSKFSQPNPIALLYPTVPTGILNGTLVVVPISYALARSIIPAQYGILKRSYETLLPALPAGKYPVSVIVTAYSLCLQSNKNLIKYQLIVRILIDHDIRVGNLTDLILDFQVHPNLMPQPILNSNSSPVSPLKFPLCRPPPRWLLPFLLRKTHLPNLHQHYRNRGVSRLRTNSSASPIFTSR